MDMRQLQPTSQDCPFSIAMCQMTTRVVASPVRAHGLRFHGGDFVEKLDYEIHSSLFRPFHFPHLAVSVSIQAGMTMKSDFLDVDGTIMSFPRWTRHVLGLVLTTTDFTTSLRMERTLFPPARAITFEVAVYSEALGCHVEPCSLSTICTCESYNGSSSPNVSRADVQTILEDLARADHKAAAKRDWEEVVLR